MIELSVGLFTFDKLVNVCVLDSRWGFRRSKVLVFNGIINGIGLYKVSVEYRRREYAELKSDLEILKKRVTEDQSKIVRG